MKKLILAMFLFASFQASVSASDPINLSGFRNFRVDGVNIGDYLVVEQGENKYGVEIAQIMLETDSDSEVEIWVGFLHILLKSYEGIVFLPHPVIIQPGDAIVAKVLRGRPLVSIWYKPL